MGFGVTDNGLEQKQLKSANNYRHFLKNKWLEKPMLKRGSTWEGRTVSSALMAIMTSQ